MVKSQKINELERTKPAKFSRATYFKPSESDLQKAIRDMLSLMGWSVFRTNVGSVKTADGRWFSSGLPKGFPDLFAVKSGKVCFIEVKVKPNVPSDEQSRFIADMISQGCRAGVAYSVEDAVSIAGGEM